MVHFEGKEANEDAKVLIQEIGVGSIIYYEWANGLESPEAVRQLSADLQQLAKGAKTSLPLIIAVDQEGGAIQTLKKGFTSFPGNPTLGGIGKAELVRTTASAMGREVFAVGCNMTLAPVVDLHLRQDNRITKARSFGSSPQLVTQFAQEAMAGFRDAGLMSVLKHFPGHGDTMIDSHLALPRVDKSKEALYQEDLFPFMELASLADAIMVGHLLVPALDPISPATFSRKIIEGVLREEGGFKGVVIADSLVMNGALRISESVKEGAILALSAGCDLLILGGRASAEDLGLSVEEVRGVHLGIVEAVRSGKIDEERIEDAFGRVLELKKRTQGAMKNPSSAGG